MQSAYGRREEFSLFASVMEATMLDKRLSDKSLQLELTIGNAGNSLDGQLLSAVGRPDATADADSVSDTTVLMNEELGEAAKDKRPRRS